MSVNNFNLNIFLLYLSGLINLLVTLVRSLRLFGSDMNYATLNVFITIDKNETYDLNYILDALTVLRAKISFIQQLNLPTPRTLNKFNAWNNFDYDNYDYLLWLDADIFIFDNAFPLLNQISTESGNLYCAPELYSYMRRYPQINSTDLFFNPNLPNFTLYGEGEIVSHGICNTGVIFMHKDYLKKFMTLLPNVVSEISLLNPFKSDRFLDSLYFVRLIHKIGKPVTVLPYELNYMANFEVEIIEETTVQDPILVHHLYETEIFCEEIAQYPFCICKYMNQYAYEDSKIVKGLRKFINKGFCRLLRGGDDHQIIENSEYFKYIEHIQLVFD